MKESISMAALFNIIIVFVTVLILIFVGSVSYSKAYKVKNKIIEEIEKDKDYNANTAESIEDWLNNGTTGESIGYRQLTGGMSDSCGKYGDGMTPVSRITVHNNYHYCLYKKNTCADANTKSKSCGTYYRAVAFMYFDLPIIGELIEIPVTGETMTFRDIHNIEDGEDFERNNS